MGRCSGKSLRTGAIRTGRSSCLASFNATPSPDQCDPGLGCAGGSIPTSLVVGTGGADNGRGWMGEMSGRDVGEEREGKRKKKEKKLWVFLGFSGFLTRIYTHPKYLE